ncbi:MAG: aminomethyltransferase family protein [Planctomycetota bacterium]|nr:aminomethyltransferase family protein [Planctomycetota bacterium]
MPVESPFHARTAPLCHSYRWKEWAGRLAVCSYGTVVDPEYLALRHASGLLDVSPLFKYEVSGPDAAALLSWVWTRDVARLEPGMVAYGCWCDERGKVVDDGTVACLEADRYRMTAAEPNLRWLLQQARGFDVAVSDESERIAALALQGPTSRRVLLELCGEEPATLDFFRGTRARVGSLDFDVTRTGYTGDLGFELWVEATRALELWDAVIDAGGDHGLMPVGLDALDITRIEAGFLLAGVDYIGARSALVPFQTSSPFELGLGWAVHLERGPFVGRDALLREQRAGSPEALVGLVADWEAIEELHARHGLPPDLPTHAWREALPVFAGGRQVGRATSGTWSATLKQSLALATVEAKHSALGTLLEIELTVAYERHTVPATVVARPFLDPPRKKARARPPEEQAD